uniref:Chitin-binding type-2 domain-containing protein n=2 Tax=Loa loa TaxID=7209 RepID=A0A1I7W1Y9_LOALO
KYSTYAIYFCEHHTSITFSLRAFEWNDEDTEWSEGMYSRVTKLKESDPELKVLLSYGGYSFGSPTFTAIAKSAEKRKHFIESAIAFLRKNKFDGFDLDWEYPTGVAREHAELVEEMKKAFVKEAKTSGKKRLLLTAAVAAGKGTIDGSYDVQSLGKNFDLLFLMSYDLHGSWEKNVDLHGKLHPTKGETSGIGIFNTEFAADYWASKGMPKKKIIIGIPTYGRGWTLNNPSETAIGAAANNPSSASTTDPAGGTAAYWEICKYLKEGGKETVDEKGVGAYMVKGNQWYGYDNEETIRIKMKWLKEKGYGGAFIWTLDFDDFKGTSCGKGPYPLLNAINNELESESTASTESFDTTTAEPETTDDDTDIDATTAEPETTDDNTEIDTTMAEPETTDDNTEIDTTMAEPETTDDNTETDTPDGCPEPNGLFPHPSDCHLFIQCSNNYLHVMHCPPTTFFNDEVKSCDHMMPDRCK